MLIFFFPITMRCIWTRLSHSHRMNTFRPLYQIAKTYFMAWLCCCFTTEWTEWLTHYNVVVLIVIQQWTLSSWFGRWWNQQWFYGNDFSSLFFVFPFQDISLAAIKVFLHGDNFHKKWNIQNWPFFVRIFSLLPKSYNNSFIRWENPVSSSNLCVFWFSYFKCQINFEHDSL